MLILELDPQTAAEMKREWPELSVLLDAPEPSWRAHGPVLAAALEEVVAHEVAAHHAAGMVWDEAESKAVEEVLWCMKNPRETARRTIGGGIARPDPKPMPPIPRRRLTKAIRDAPGGLFDGMDGGNSSTYKEK